MKIHNRTIDLNSKPFIVAEMSGNHNQSLQRAIRIIELAAKSGVDAIKLQTYTADTITLKEHKNEFEINDENSIWYGRNLYELYQEAHTPWEWHEPLMKKAKQLGLICFSSPFDETAVEFLEDLNCPAYKIASPEIIHSPLIERVVSTGKPIIISTGMASLKELDEVVNYIVNNGGPDYAILKCTSSYPASPGDSNLITIPTLRKIYNCEIGFSDHTLGLGASLAAVGLGATIIEKHFTLNRLDGGVDSTFSLNPTEMEQLVYESENAWLSVGNVQFGPCKSEVKTIKQRRSIYIAKNIKKGEIITESHLKVIRPGFGIKPKYYKTIKGMTIKRDVEKGTAFSWEFLK